MSVRIQIVPAPCSHCRDSVLAPGVCAEIVDHWNAGMPTSELASRFGIGHLALTDLLEAHGITALDRRARGIRLRMESLRSYMDRSSRVRDAVTVTRPVEEQRLITTLWAKSWPVSTLAQKFNASPEEIEAIVERWANWSRPMPEERRRMRR